MRRSLKPLVDALDFEIGKGSPISALRTKLATLREQADAIESDLQMAEAERDDYKAKLNQAEKQITSLKRDVLRLEAQNYERDQDERPPHIPVVGL
jgi:chromosome segregation ATPase